MQQQTVFEPNIFTKIKTLAAKLSTLFEHHNSVGFFFFLVFRLEKTWADGNDDDDEINI